MVTIKWNKRSCKVAHSCSHIFPFPPNIIIYILRGTFTVAHRLTFKHVDMNTYTDRIWYMQHPVLKQDIAHALHVYTNSIITWHYITHNIKHTRIQASFPPSYVVGMRLGDEIYHQRNFYDLSMIHSLSIKKKLVGDRNYKRRQCQRVSSCAIWRILLGAHGLHPLVPGSGGPAEGRANGQEVGVLQHKEARNREAYF